MSDFERMLRTILAAAKTNCVKQLVWAEDALLCLYWQIQSWNHAFKGLCILDSALQYLLKNCKHWVLCSRCGGAREVIFNGVKYDVCAECGNLGVICLKTGRHKGRHGLYVNGKLSCQNCKKPDWTLVTTKRMVMEPIVLKSTNGVKVEIVKDDDREDEQYKEIWVDADNIFP